MMQFRDFTKFSDEKLDQAISDLAGKVERIRAKYRIIPMNKANAYTKNRHELSNARMEKRRRIA